MFPAPCPVRRQPLARRLSSFLLPAAGWLGWLAGGPLAAQQPTEGFAANLTALPSTTSLVLTTTAGTVLFDGTAVTLLAPSQPPQVLLQLPAFMFGSFLLQSGPGHVLLGYAGMANDIWLLPLQGPTPTQPLAVLPFNYDATMLDANRALVSARTGGFSATDNELWVLDLTTGSTQRLASIAGASGPVAIAGNGDVYYATGFAGFPVPPGTTRVLRLPRPRVDAALAAGRVLGIAHAEVVMTGLDAAADMAFDDDGDLLFVDWFNVCIGEVSDATGPQPSLVPTVVDYSQSNVSPTTVQFVGSSQGGIFEAFQPANGTLQIHETDYVSLSRARQVTSRPPALAIPQAMPLASGPFAFFVNDGPSLGLGLLAFGFGSTPGTIVLQVPGFEAPLHWSPALAASPVLVPITFDGLGQATWNGLNPGFAPVLTAVAQVAVVSGTGALGATAPIVVLIGQ